MILNTMNARYHASAPERAWQLASENYQLLTLLHVLQGHTSGDADQLAQATRQTLAFPAETSRADRESPIDPGARTRDTLAAARAVALAFGSLALAGNAEPAAPAAARAPAHLLREMADACQGLSDWIALNDQSFEQLDPLDPPGLAAA